MVKINYNKPIMKVKFIYVHSEAHIKGTGEIVANNDPKQIKKRIKGFLINIFGFHLAYEMTTSIEEIREIF